jgi:hypothetical protein
MHFDAYQCRTAENGFEGRDSHRTIFASARIIDHRAGAAPRQPNMHVRMCALSVHPFLFPRR